MFLRMLTLKNLYTFRPIKYIVKANCFNCFEYFIPCGVLTEFITYILTAIDKLGDICKSDSCIQCSIKLSAIY